MSGAVTHWDEIEPRPIRGEHLHGARGRFGPAMGAVRSGLSRYDLGPGERPMPLHSHADEEEIAFVLRGSGVTTDGELAWPIAADDTIVWPAGGRPHAIVAGPEGLSVLVFGSGSDTHLTWLPRAQTMWAGPRWLPLDGPHPFAAEDAAGPLLLGYPEEVRPPHVVALADVPAISRDLDGIVCDRRRVGAAAGATRSGLSHVTVAPDASSSLPHCHTGVEELFVVLGGSGVLLLHDAQGEPAAEHAVRPGSLVGRPASTAVAHSFRAGSDGVTLLAYGRDDPNDICFYPRSQTAAIRGLGIIARLEPVGYMGGTPSPPS